MTQSDYQGGRVLGVDLGSKRIGIAVSDARGTMASPVTVVQRSGSLDADHRKIAALITEEEAVRVVVGLPVALSGQKSIAAQNVQTEVNLMTEALDVPVETWDERMTSAAAHKNLKAQGLSEKKRREQIDKWAAVSILQGWLDRWSPRNDR